MKFSKVEKSSTFEKSQGGKDADQKSLKKNDSTIPEEESED